MVVIDPEVSVVSPLLGQSPPLLEDRESTLRSGSICISNWDTVHNHWKADTRMIQNRLSGIKSQSTNESILVFLLRYNIKSIVHWLIGLLQWKYNTFGRLWKNPGLVMCRKCLDSPMSNQAQCFPPPPVSPCPQSTGLCLPGSCWGRPTPPPPLPPPPTTSPPSISPPSLWPSSPLIVTVSSLVLAVWPPSPVTVSPASPRGGGHWYWSPDTGHWYTYILALCPGTSLAPSPTSPPDPHGSPNPCSPMVKKPLPYHVDGYA